MRRLTPTVADAATKAIGGSGSRCNESPALGLGAGASCLAVDLVMPGSSRTVARQFELAAEDLRQNPAVAMRSPRSSIHRLSLYFGRLVGRLLGRESAWDAIRMPVPPGAFGPGSRRPFPEYFSGETTVRVRSLDEIVEWLQGCEYAADSELFHERDVWQHPGAFERGRRGDCEDFALWAWRKLADIGVDAEFCVGRVIVADDRPEINRQHAWVLYRVDDTEFLFEPAARIRSRMIRPLADAIDEYVPHFAVNHRFATRAFAGCLNGKTAKSANALFWPAFPSRTFVASQQKGRPV